jgi:hypothetical protein
VNKQSYWEKLKDPRWQRLRLEAMQAAEFSCETCHDATSTLNVHHKQYFKGREPWEYDVKQLAVLCERCHEERHEEEDSLNLTCSFLLLDGPFSRKSAASLVVGFASVPHVGYEDQLAFLAGIIAKSCIRANPVHGELEEVSNFADRNPEAMFRALLHSVRSAK